MGTFKMNDKNICNATEFYYLTVSCYLKCYITMIQFKKKRRVDGSFYEVAKQDLLSCWNNSRPRIRSFYAKDTFRLSYNLHRKRHLSLKHISFSHT